MNPSLSIMMNGETIVDQSTTTSYYVEVQRLNGEWVKVGPKHASIEAARRWGGDQNSLGHATRLLVHTRHILDVDTWIVDP
jgi:hypothetical protein